jgi:glycosyltransferase involved in cell wall biosynthesis
MPTAAMASLERGAITGYIGISPWASRVLRQNTSLPVYTWLMGVSEAFKYTEQSREMREYAVLHMASTNNERKGTAQLIEAWASCLRARTIPTAGSALRLVCDGPAGFFADAIDKATRGDKEIADTYDLQARLDLTDEQACDLYQHHHLVCQPSRGEGFGMVPLEARASGVAVVMTNGTGHDAHCWYDSQLAGGMRFLDNDCPAGVLIVPVAGSAPIDDGPGAKAPTFETDKLARALALGYACRNKLTAAARQAAPWVAAHWSWKRVCQRFIDCSGVFDG